MHLVNDQESHPIESESELRSYFANAGKPATNWRVGTERELIGVSMQGTVGAAPDYESGIGRILSRLHERGWQAVREGEAIIALINQHCSNEQITIEPGGQLELAARPLNSASELRDDLDRFACEIREVSQELGLTWLAMGFRPFGRLSDVPWMPKDRYVVMREYLPSRGHLAHEMMRRTATVQVNLDFDDADDAAEKMRAAIGAGAILTAIYANSPVVDGEISDFQSYRARIWRDTDPDRCGLLPFVFEEGDIFSQYSQWALDVPMFFVYRQQRYLPAGGITFRRFLREGFQGSRATIDDWSLHLSTLFPEVRMKRYLELRSCDSGSRAMSLALGSLCRGMLYDADARRAIIDLTSNLSMDQRQQLWTNVAQSGLRARVPGTTFTVLSWARQLVRIAVDGLRRQAPDDVAYLAAIEQIVETERTQADDFIELWRQHHGEPAPIIQAMKEHT